MTSSRDAMHVEDDIQIYFSEEIARSIKRFYCDVLDEYHYFGYASNITPPLSINPNFKPDVVHVSEIQRARSIRECASATCGRTHTKSQTET